jgi:hypothetical protein
MAKIIASQDTRNLIEAHRDDAVAKAAKNRGK